MTTVEQKADNYAGLTEDKHANIAHTYSKLDIAEAFEAGEEFASKKQSFNLEVQHDIVIATNSKGDTFTFPNNNRYEELLDFFLSHEEGLKL